MGEFVAIIWQIQLFNGPVLLDASGEETRRFRSHKVGALLAYLALNLNRPCSREELYEALWPEEDSTLAANRFRVTLASLRRQLEPENIGFGTVLDVSEPGRVRLRAEAVTCDAAECDRLTRAGRNKEAARFVTGTLLPGFYEEWATNAQFRYQLISDDTLLTTNTSRPGQSVETFLPADEPSWEPRLPVFLPANRSLPLYLTRFFGRESEQLILIERIESHRLVSLIGMGGIGKTRLASEAINEWRGEALFVSLVPLPDPSRLYDTVLKSLGVSPQMDCPLEEQVARVLNRRGELLLILDNAEHLNDAVAEMALLLLAEVPDLRLLVTSRQRLNIAGESVLLLAPLEAPGPTARPERLMEFATVSLFTDRAKNARPDFVLTEKNAPSVVEICQRLEGHPLALELAAARITSQTPQQIALALQHRITDLKARQHGLSPRHQSLRAVIQGSLDQLSQEQREFFVALSVFQGGWTLEAAKAVTLCNEAEDHLNHLTVCSLVVTHEEERLGSMRYSLHETLRQFAAESLSPEKLEEYREHHARFYISLAELTDGEDFRFQDMAEADHENISLVLERLWQNDRETLVQTLSFIMNCWGNRGYHRLALGWIARVLPNEQLISTGFLKVIYRVYADVGRYEDAERVARRVQETVQTPLQKAWVNTCLGIIRTRQGRWDDAVEFQLNAIETAQRIEGEARAHYVRLVSYYLGDALNCRAEYAPENPDPASDFKEAERHVRAGFVAIEPNSRLYSMYYHCLMRSLWGQNREAEGDECFANALRFALSHRHMTSLVKIIGDGAFRLARKGFPEESVRFLSSYELLREKMGYKSPLYFEARVQEQLLALRELLGSETFEQSWRMGVYTPLEEILLAAL